MSKKQKDAYAIAEISNILYEAYNTGGLGVEAGEVTSKAQAIKLKEDIHDLAIEAYPMLKSFFDNNNSTLKDAQDQLAAVYSHVEDMKDEVVNEKRRADELVDQLERVQKELDACLEMAPKKEEIIVIGGHADSIAGFWGGAKAHAPGADDNASGISTITEIIRVFLESGVKPERTVQFN